MNPRDYFIYFWIGIFNFFLFSEIKENDAQTAVLMRFEFGSIFLLFFEP